MVATVGGFIIDPNGATLVVDVLTAGGARPVAYTAVNGSSTHSLPVTITTRTAFYFASPLLLRVSAKLNDTEIAGREGTTATVDVQQGSVTVLTPGVDSPSEYGAFGGGGSGVVEAVVAGTGITVDATDPANPVVAQSGTSVLGWKSIPAPSWSVNSNDPAVLAHGDLLYVLWDVGDRMGSFDPTLADPDDPDAGWTQLTPPTNSVYSGYGRVFESVGDFLVCASANGGVSWYDPTDDAGGWTAIDPEPHPDDYAAPIVVGGLLYLFGCAGNEGDVGHVDILDPADWSWSAGANMPFFFTAGMAWLDPDNADHIIIQYGQVRPFLTVASVDGPKFSVADRLIYVISTDSWAGGASGGIVTNLGASVTLDGEVWMFDGRTTQMVNAETGFQGPPLIGDTRIAIPPVFADSFSAAVLAGVAYVCANGVGLQYLTTVEAPALPTNQSVISQQLFPSLRGSFNGDLTFYAKPSTDGMGGAAIYAIGDSYAPGLKSTGLMLLAPTPPSNAAIPYGTLWMYFDSTDGAAKLIIRGRSADGTPVSGEVALAP